MDGVSQRILVDDLSSAYADGRGSRRKEMLPLVYTSSTFRDWCYFASARVVPAIAASGVPFAVVQRPKPRWEQIFSESEEIDVCVNGEVKMKGAQVLAAHERPPVSDSEFQTNLNLMEKDTVECSQESDYRTCSFSIRLLRQKV